MYKISFCSPWSSLDAVIEEEIPTLPYALIEEEPEGTKLVMSSHVEPLSFTQGLMMRIQAQKFKRLIDLLTAGKFNKVRSTATPNEDELKDVILVQQT